VFFVAYVLLYFSNLTSPSYNGVGRAFKRGPYQVPRTLELVLALDGITAVSVSAYGLRKVTLVDKKSANILLE